LNSNALLQNGLTYISRIYIPKIGCRSTNIKQVIDLNRIDINSFKVDTYESCIPEKEKITFRDLMLEIGRLIVDIDKCEKTLEKDESKEIKSDNT